MIFLDQQTENVFSRSSLQELLKGAFQMKRKDTRNNSHLPKEIKTMDKGHTGEYKMYYYL